MVDVQSPGETAYRVKTLVNESNVDKSTVF